MGSIMDLAAKDHECIPRLVPDLPYIVNISCSTLFVINSHDMQLYLKFSRSVLILLKPVNSVHAFRLSITRHGQTAPM